MAGNFQELEDVVFIMGALSKSDLFTKMLYNVDDDAENIDLPIGESNLSLIEYESMFPYMKVIDLSETGVKAYVNIYYGLSKNTAKTKAFRRNYLFVDIYVHQDIWKISTGIRTYKIMQEVDKIINEKQIENISNTFTFDEYKAIPSVNTKYAGFGVIYHRNDIGVSGCGYE